MIGTACMRRFGRLLLERLRGDTAFQTLPSPKFAANSTFRSRVQDIGLNGWQIDL